jgi:glycerol uptake operon antiterminator
MKKTARSHDIRQWLSRPIIPVVSKVDADAALAAEASLLFLQGCELADLSGILDELKSGPTARLPVMLHIDLLAGLTSDEAGLRFLAGLARIDGIITVRPHLVSAARKQGLASILLLFLQDGRAVERGLHIVEQSQPDAIELVPGAAALEVAPTFAKVAMPRIAGGLIRTADLARRLLEAGCDAVSTSTVDLWQLNRQLR